MIDFKFIGWCKEEGHDKVWVAFSVGEKHYACWGKRDKHLSFKEYGTGYRAEREQQSLISKKKQKYQEVDPFMLFTIFPRIEEDIEQRLTFAILADKVK